MGKQKTGDKGIDCHGLNRMKAYFVSDETPVGGCDRLRGGNHCNFEDIVVGLHMRMMRVRIPMFGYAPALEEVFCCCAFCGAVRHGCKQFLGIRWADLRSLL